MPYTPLYAQNFVSTTPFGSDLSNLFVSGNAFVTGTMNVIARGFYMNTLTVNSNLIVTTNSYIGTTLNVVQYINTAFLNTAGITTTGNIANTFGNVAITGNIITTNIFCTNLISQSNISNTFGNVAITGNLVTSQNIYCFNLVTQSNIANTYGNVAVSGNLITTNIFCTNLISQSNISNTYGNVAITGNLVTTNIFCTNLISQSNISNTYGNVALTGNLITTNIFCTNIISQSNISNTFGNVAVTGNLVTSQNLYAENMILRTNMISTSATVKITGNAIIQRDLQVSSNLTVNGFITDFFQLIGSSYFFLYNQFNLPAPQTKNNGIEFFGMSLNDFNNASQVIPTQSSKYLYAITTNGNFRFNQTGLFKVTCVFATDHALGRIGIGNSTNDYAKDARPTNMAYAYLYQYDVTQVPTVPVTLPILVTDTNQIYYIDIMAYRTLPTVIYETAKIAGDYTSAVGGTYIAIGPF
jgi:hypothetical protein